MARSPQMEATMSTLSNHDVLLPNDRSRSGPHPRLQGANQACRQRTREKAQRGSIDTAPLTCIGSVKFLSSNDAV